MLLLLVGTLIFAALVFSEPRQKYIDLRGAVVLVVAIPVAIYALISSLAVFALRQRRHGALLAHFLAVAVCGFIGIFGYRLTGPPGPPPIVFAEAAVQTLSARLAACVVVDVIGGEVTDAGDVVSVEAAITNLCAADLVVDGIKATLHHYADKFPFVGDARALALPRGEVVTIPLRGAHRVIAPRTLRWRWRVDLALASPPAEFCFASSEITARGCAAIGAARAADPR